MPDWIIYFDDGTIFSSNDGSPCDAPNKGVVCIASRAQNTVVKDGDWYRWTPTNGWVTHSLTGMLYQVCNAGSEQQAVRQGAMVSDLFWKTTVEAANAFLAG